MSNSFSQTIRALKCEAYALYLAYRDPRCPWYAKVFTALVVAHTFSPIDLIPDFIPLLGSLDDLLITPLGIYLALKMIPPQVMAEARQQASTIERGDKSIGRAGLWLVIVTWMVGCALLIYLMHRLIILGKAY